ncbi:MAG: glycine cleavage system H protein [Hyphomicrobiaceae bacterium]|jgi:glycine cleavage system H protein
MDIPEDLKFTKEHEWVRREVDGTMLVGITEYAQEQLGDIVFVELPNADDEPEIERDQPMAVVESVKAASDVYAPISGKVVEVNDELPNSPAVINEDPYGDGWLVRFEPSNESELAELMTPEEYSELVDDLSD